MAFGAAALLAGCATPEAPLAPAAPDPVQTQIDESLNRKSAERVTGPEVVVARPVYAAASTTASYFGDASNLLKDVAKAMNWEFKVTGPQPRLPIFVQIDVKNVTLENFLGQVAAQLSQRADIAISGGVIELRYRAN